jgi:hypothetical protein
MMRLARTVVATAISCCLLSASAWALDPVQLRWLDKAAPALPVGTAWGVPFKPGEVQKGATFALAGQDGKAVPVQSWPLAYWPDGSIKWEGFAAVGEKGAESLTLTLGQAAAPAAPVRVAQDDAAVTVTNGRAVYRLPKRGSALVESVLIHGQSVGEGGRFIALEEVRSQENGQRVTREAAFESTISALTVEQEGPVRAVVKVEGKYAGKVGEATREWLPFTVRFYFYSGADAVRVVHSFVFDGDQEKDFLRGIGLRFTVPLRQPPYNRHVRFAGDEGLFMEPVQVVVGRRVGPSPAVEAQVQGQPLTPSAQQMPNVQQMAVWDGYRLTQLSADGYELEKRTGAHSAYIRSTAGRRARGLAFLGDTSGGLALGLKNFWQMYPTELEIQNAGASAGQITLWLHSPTAPAMDMRHYDVKEHGLEASYEDITPGLSTATGIARTHELVLAAFPNVPDAASLNALADAAAKSPQIVATPEYLHGAKAFGVWSLPNRSNASRAAMEDALDRAIRFYQDQVEQRNWYGFWDFGDFMHSYDPTRHEWKYDIGGYAWQNTELAPDIWLWLSFLRSGRADVFRMAEAMTRHTQEVDVYHSGPLKGLGSRHNVRHWGDGAKELRVAQAGLKRYYYYLTTDERTGDLLNEVIDADQALLKADPLRKLPGIENEKKYPTHLRAGPDWFALCANWLTAWERTGDPKYLGYVKAGVESFYAMPRKLFSGGSFGYDPATKKVHMLFDRAEMPHLAALMGGPEFWMEFTPVLNDPHWTEMWLQYCRYLQSPPAEHNPVLGGNVGGDRLGPHFAKMTAYAARYAAPDDAALSATLTQRAWSEFLGRGGVSGLSEKFAPKTISPPIVPAPVTELSTGGTGSITNDAAQWNLNAIELLELVGDKIPQ